jgi:hypothetical protein
VVGVRASVVLAPSMPVDAALAGGMTLAAGAGIGRRSARAGGRAGRSSAGGLGHVDVGGPSERLGAAGDQQPMRREARAPAERRWD